MHFPKFQAEIFRKRGKKGPWPHTDQQNEEAKNSQCEREEKIIKNQGLKNSFLFESDE